MPTHALNNCFGCCWPINRTLLAFWLHGKAEMDIEVVFFFVKPLVHSLIVLTAGFHLCLLSTLGK